MTLTEVFTKAIQNTLLGMGVVFAILIFIILIISQLQHLPGLIARFSPASGSEEREEDTATQSPAAADEDDTALIAVIAAAIAAHEGAANGPQGDSYTVRSVRRV